MNGQGLEAEPPRKRMRGRWTAVAATGVVLAAVLMANPAISDQAPDGTSATQMARATTLVATSPTPVPAPSFAPSSRVGPWSPARYAFDWPGSPRIEPAEGPTLVQLMRGDDAHWDPSEGRWEGLEHVDPAGDGVPGLPWLDIVEVRAGWGVVAPFTIQLAGRAPRPLPSPEEHWIAFGIVLDTNHDGRPDIRLGIDNMPSGEHRAWRTDYGLGLTAWKAGPSYGFLDQGLPKGTSNDTWYPGDKHYPDQSHFRYSLETGEEQAGFYAWAALIADGRLVATDFAPDAGWLVFDDGSDLPLLGNDWDIESVTSPEGTASVEDWFTMRATFTEQGELTIDACERIDALVTVDGSLIWLRAVTLTPIGGCRPEMQAIDRVVRAVVQAPIIEYTIERGVLVLRAGDNSVRLIGSTDP